MTCEEVDSLLLDFVEGEVPDAGAGAIRAHLRDCPGCAAKARETRNLLGDFGVAASIERRAWSSQDGTLAESPPRPVGRPARLGDFEILEELGRGGMGIVYRARQVTLNRIVALKVLQAGVVLNERAVARFQKEAQAAARLHHTNIVPIYSQGEQDGFFYYAMELIQGQPLDRVLNRSPQLVTLIDVPLDARTAGAAPSSTHPQSTIAPTVTMGAAATTLAAPVASHAPSTMNDGHAAQRSPDGATVYLTRRHAEYKRIARLVAEVADALHHAHQQGIVHRDIKPQNLLLGQDDKLHITDFGLARLLDEPHLTLSAEIIGTPSYMSPEQIRGVRDDIDPRTDIYSLGVTLYQMLTLRTPFTGESYDQIITRILKQEPRSPRRLDPNIPGDIETICLRAMEKEPRKRFATAKELADDLRRYAGDFPIVSRRIGPVGKLVRLVKRHPARSGVVISAAVIAMLIPTLLYVLTVSANRQIAAAYEQLIEDYRRGPAALENIGWLTTTLGDDRMLTLARALAVAKDHPEDSVAILEDHLARDPDHRDAGYLLAWTLNRTKKPWTSIEDQVARTDKLATEVSPAGSFFRAQSLMWSDPIEADRSFDDAISRRQSFTQAMLHQARAVNHRMYLLRRVEAYDKAVSRLTAVCILQPHEAYPRYVRAITHRLAAEYYAENGDAARAHEMYARCLEAAREAQKVQPKDGRGYAAEGEYLESRGLYDAALETWNRIDGDKCGTKGDLEERDIFAMRLYFWRANYDAAQQRREGAFPEPKYPLKKRIERTLFEALIARSAGDLTRAQRALDAAFTQRPAATIWRLELAAAYKLSGLEPPSALFDETCDDGAELWPRWSDDWVRALADCLSGRRPWSDAEIEAVAQREASVVPDADSRRIRYQLLIAGARYYRGVWLLADGQRDAAMAQFSAWWRHPDSENYCYRSKLLYLKLKLDPTWPAWLPATPSE